MKKSALILAMSICTSLMFAQSPLGKGGKQLNAGAGFSTYGLPVYVGMDFGIHPDITIGGEISWRNYRHSNKFDGYDYSHNVFGFYFNCNYHFNTILKIPSNWDFYAGGNVGFNYWTHSSGWNDSYNDSYASGLGFGGQVGGRYYFNDKFGLNLEFSGGNVFNGGKFGISLKF